MCTHAPIFSLRGFTLLENWYPRSLYTPFHCSVTDLQDDWGNGSPKADKLWMLVFKYLWMFIIRITTANGEKSKKARGRIAMVSLGRDQNHFKPPWIVSGMCSHGIIVWSFACCISIYSSLRLMKREDLYRGFNTLCHLERGQVCVNTCVYWWPLNPPKWGDHHSGCSQAQNLTTSRPQGFFCTSNKRAEMWKRKA